MATSRQSPKFPKQKPKKGENPTTKTSINQRPVTPDVSFANVCSNKFENQMAPREEAPKISNQSPIEKENPQTTRNQILNLKNSQPISMKYKT
ncbi:hypothetical protein TNCV_4489991 [Trichonephila clavipes]|nr:hypothetical protein TNCV_4489991 [Trichonephila clavipes]